MELHHGEVSVRSQPGEGTEFTIRLPLGKEHLMPDEIVDTPVSPPPRGELRTGVEAKQPMPEIEEVELVTHPSEGLEPSEGLKEKTVILVVEDNTDVRTYIRQHLEPLYKVVEASDGAEGVEVALETIPDLIISDVMMPNMDGYELCRILKNDIHTSHVPVILLTAKASQEHKIEGLETGADDYLIKPFDSKELLIRVKNLIELRRQLQERYRQEFLMQPKEATIVSMDDQFLKSACDVVEDRMSDPELDVEKLSREMAMSRRNLHRKLRALVGKTPQPIYPFDSTQTSCAAAKAAKWNGYGNCF